jgi:hypothetical protein
MNSRDGSWELGGREIGDVETKREMEKEKKYRRCD